MTEYPVTERFDRLLREFGALVTEARIYGNERNPGETFQMMKLADEVAEVIYPWAAACGYTWEQLEAMGTEIDAAAITKVSPGGWDDQSTPFER